MAVVVSIAGLAVLAYCTWVWWTQWHVPRRRLFKLAEKIPGWPTLPIIGNLHQFCGEGNYLVQLLHRVVEEMEKNRKGVLKMWFAPLLTIWISKFEDVKMVTNTFVEKPYFYTFGSELLGNGVLIADAQSWRKKIKNVSNAFSTTALDGFIPIFNEQTRIMAESMKKEFGKGFFDVYTDYVIPITMEIITQTTFGVSYVTSEEGKRRFREEVELTLKLVLERGMNPLMHPDFIFHLTPSYRKLCHSVEYIHKVIEVALEKRREVEKLRQIQGDDKVPKNEFRCFADVLLELIEKGMFKHEEIFSELYTSILAGYDTSTFTQMMILVMLGAHKEAQDKVYREIIEIFGDSDRPVEKEDLGKMTYTEAVIKETLRLYPPVPVVFRMADKRLNLTEFEVPNKTIFLVSPWCTGRDVHVWGPDVNKFRPERWFDELPAIKPFIAFSYGRRACIGKIYSMYMLKILLANVLRKVEFTSESSDVQLYLEITLKPKKGHMVKASPRKPLTNGHCNGFSHGY